ATGNAWPTTSTQSRVGPSGRVLANGSWDGWTFVSPIVLESFPSNPAAASPQQQAADFDSDGDADGADFLIWQRGFRLKSAGPSQGDADGDGAVTVADFAAWKSSFGASPLTANVAPLSQQVPEPIAFAQLSSF